MDIEEETSETSVLTNEACKDSFFSTELAVTPESLLTNKGFFVCFCADSNVIGRGANVPPTTETFSSWALMPAAVVSETSLAARETIFSCSIGVNVFSCVSSSCEVPVELRI